MNERAGLRSRRALDLCERLVRRLTRRRRDLALTDFEIFAAGLEFLVVRAVSRRYGTVALRTPWSRRHDSDNDDAVDTRELLVREERLCRHLAAQGVPVAAPIELILDDGGCDVLVSAFVEHDASTVDDTELIACVERLHEVPAADVMGVPRADAVLVERIVRRVQALERRIGDSLGLPERDVLAELHGRSAARSNLLHLDLRTANVLARAGRPVALVDWSNALIGEPELEWARLDEYRRANDGQACARIGARCASGALGALHRLDAAVMLANVFTSEAPDRARAERQVARVRRLATEVGAAT